LVKKGTREMNIEEIKDSLQKNNFIGLRARLHSPIEFIDSQQAGREALKKLVHQRFYDGKRLGIIETED
jgi:hypothetical protein